MEREKLSIICFSGEFDKVFAAFTFATGAAATNYDVCMFFTFWGLNALKKKQGRSWMGKGVLDRIFNFLMGGLKKLPLSRLNFGGVSPLLMTYMMKKNNVATLPELIDAAKQLGVKLFACEIAMHILGIEKEALIDEVEEVIGVASFLDYSKGARIIFI